MAAFGVEGRLGAGWAAGVPGGGVLLPAHAEGSRLAGGSWGGSGLPLAWLRRADRDPGCPWSGPPAACPAPHRQVALSLKLPMRREWGTRRLGLAKRVFSCYPEADVELPFYRSQQGSPLGAGPSPPDEVCLEEQSVLLPWQDRDACLAFFFHAAQEMGNPSLGPCPVV